MNFDPEKVRQAARKAIPLTIKTYTLPHDLEIQLEEILHIFLEEIGQEAIKDAIFYCLRELAVNAKKANTKRVFFHERGLNLLDPNDYKTGMESFKEDTLGNIQHYLKLQEESDLYIKIRFELKGGILNMFVANNTEITKKEQMRVYDRITRARVFSSMEEAFSLVLDDSEGAGLGIVIMILMLRKIGLDEDAFDIDTEAGETVARLSIPMSQLRSTNLDEVSELLVSRIESIPQFPENVATLQRQLGDPDIEMGDIARSIATDPAMTADLLKLVNSAAFMLPKRVENISEAIKLVGLRALKNLLYSYGTQKVLGDENDDTRGLWDHSYKTAFFSYTLTRSMLKRKDLLDDAYVGGILHDIGKLIFSSVHPELLRNIKRFCEERSIPTVIFEDISAGLNHAEIGARIAEKWNFPAPLVAAIRFHHEPSECPTVHRTIASIVYIANLMAQDPDEVRTLDDLDPEALNCFGFTNFSQFDHVRTRLNTAFIQESAQRE